MTLIRSRSRGTSESGQRRDTASCAALRRIGRRKVPAEARKSARRPEGVVDVAAVLWWDRPPALRSWVLTCLRTEGGRTSSDA
jgi:hypothetical protein